MAGVNSDVTASAYVKDSRIVIRNRRRFDEQIATMREGQELVVEVTRRRATRSLLQNAYYWGVVVELISEYTGYTPEEVHECFKMKFIPKRLAVCDGNGEVKDEFVIGGSTRKMNTIEFGEYVESIRRFAAEDLDLYIPDPND